MPKTTQLLPRISPQTFLIVLVLKIQSIKLINCLFIPHFSHRSFDVEPLWSDGNRVILECIRLENIYIFLLNRFIFMLLEYWYELNSKKKVNYEKYYQKCQTLVLILMWHRSLSKNDFIKKCLVSEFFHTIKYNLKFRTDIL